MYAKCLGCKVGRGYSLATAIFDSAYISENLDSRYLETLALDPKCSPESAHPHSALWPNSCQGGRHDQVVMGPTCPVERVLKEQQYLLMG